MNKILSRKEFIEEVYTPMAEYEELKAINEGLLKTIFGKIRGLFTNDWKKIKGDQGIINAYKEMDDKLSGFANMKASKRDQCNQIRQALVDFAGLWYEKKEAEAKKAKEEDEGGAEIKPAKTMKFKDDALKDSLAKCESKIKTVADGDNQMIKWANMLKDDMVVIINQVLINEIDDEETKKKIEKQTKEAEKKREELNKKMEEVQNKQLEELVKEREKYISDTQATPFKGDLLGDKAIQNIVAEFDKISKEKDPDKKIDLYKNDTYFGHKSLYTDEDFKNKQFKNVYKMTAAFYASLGANDVMDKFKEVAGQSVQAMCISINSFIKNCFYGGTDYGNCLPLMAKCAIVSNGCVGYNLPPNDKGDGNYYTDIMNMIAEGKFNKDTKGKEIKMPDDFEKNAKTLMNKIVDEAKKLKEEGEKKYNEEMKK